MRSKRALLNIIVSLLFEGVTVVSGFIIPRLLIKEYGSSVYGLITSITQFLGYLLLLRSGIGGVVRAALYKPLADKDNHSLSVVIKTTDLFFKKLGLISAIYILLLALLMPIIDVEKSTYLYTSILVLIIGAGAFMQYYFGITYQIVLQADQKSNIYTALDIILTTIKVALVVVLVQAGSGIHVVMLASAVLFAIKPLAVKQYVQKKYAVDKRCAPDKGLIKQRWDGFGNTVAYFIHSKTDVFLLTVFSGVKEVAVYSIYALVTNGLTKLISSLSSGVQDAFGNMIAKEENRLLEKNFKAYECFNNIITTVLFSSAIVLIMPFVKIYAREFSDTEYIRPLAAYLILSAECVYCLRQPYHSIITSAGHYRQTRKGAFIEAAINVVISLVLVHKMGLVGISIGTLAAMVYRTFDYYIYMNKNLLRLNIMTFVKRFAVSILNIACVAAVLLNMLPVPANGYTTWVYYALITFSLSFIFTVGVNFVFYRMELITIISIGKRLIQKGR